MTKYYRRRTPEWWEELAAAAAGGAAGLAVYYVARTLLGRDSLPKPRPDGGEDERDAGEERAARSPAGSGDAGAEPSR